MPKRLLFLPLPIVGIFMITWVLTHGVTIAQTPNVNDSTQALNIRYEDLKWQKMVPELGDRSPEMTILRINPETKATDLMIRVPNNFHVPKHWHTGNETHTVISGVFIVDCNGQREELGPGSFNYTPHGMAHEAWTTANEGALLFITVDTAFDINWVNGPPRLEDYEVKNVK